MPRQNRLERRLHPRIALLGDFNGAELSSVDGSSRTEFHAAVQDVSSGGIGLLTNYPIHESSVIRGRVCLPGTKVEVPSILRVRWISRGPSEPQYRVGLQYLV